jgi:cysteine-rich repeat protein
LSCNSSCGGYITSSCSSSAQSCGNGIREGSEGCDDGDTTPGDGCSASCTIETGYSCVGEPSVCTSTAVCGNGVINSGEACDDGDTSSGDGCSSTCSVESGWTCANEPSICNPISSCGRNGCQPSLGENCETCSTDCGDCCGDNTCTSGYGEDCETCSEDCTWNPSTEECVDGEIVSLCDLTSAYWSTTSILSDGLVLLNVKGTNCEGKNISFVVMEKDDDGLFDADDRVTHDPANIIYGSPTTYGTWISELQDDSAGFEENPPEYYFVATVVTTGESVTSSQNDEDMLKVYDKDVICAGVNYCANYATESDCENDIYLCKIGVNSVPETVTCGGSFNPATGCYDYTNCGCTWDATLETCGADWNFESSCGVCGNHVRDFGEECDDGNVISGDGCSSSCKFEGTLNPCGEGLTLCLDLTCSLNCYITDVSVSECNYNDICDADEGCTCSDCDGEVDKCEAGLLCSIFDTGCCTSTSDNECNPYCAFVDPDCGPADCGNGIVEFEEECDLGTRNDVTNSGCLADCTLEVIIPGENGCPEGTTLCNDGTCSLNCYQTDEGVADCNNDGICDVGEGCTCSDCDEEEDTCESGLLCSLVDQACCNTEEDNFCNRYCAFVDPDCEPQGLRKGIFSVGTCSYTETSQDTCKDDGMLTRFLSALWTWDPENIQHIDPLRKQDRCVYIEDTLSCPASAQVSFFGIYQIVIAAGLVVLIYLIYFLRKRKHHKKIRKIRKKSRK